MRKTLSSLLRKLALWFGKCALWLDPVPPAPPAPPVIIQGGGGPGEERQS